MVDIQKLICLSKQVYDAMQDDGICGIGCLSMPEVQMQDWLFAKTFRKDSAVHEYRADTYYAHEFHVDVSGVRFYCISDREDIYGTV